jgi:hypothetical protein
VVARTGARPRLIEEPGQGHERRRGQEWRGDESPALGDLREGNDNDHADQQDRYDRVGMARNIEIEHGFRPFIRLDGAFRVKV